MEQLNENGYLVIENKNSNVLFENKANEFYKDNKVNYALLKRFIDDTYFPELNKKLYSLNNLNYGKFRFSNNNNSTDASTFHGDTYNYTDENIINVYTFLYYFDDAYLEIIPKSHRKDFNLNNSAHESYHNKKQIPIKAGSFVVFHSNIHHRGVGFNKTDNRRLLQIFEVTINDDDYKKYREKIIIIETSQSYLIKIMNIINKYVFSKITKSGAFNNFITYIHYMFVYNNLHYKYFTLNDLSSSEKKDKIISYEPGKNIDISKGKSCKETNINILCDPNIKHTSRVKYYFYCYLIYWIISSVLLYLLYKYNVIKKLSKRKKSFFKRNGLMKKINIFKTL